jgi:hypothetical protein
VRTDPAAATDANLAWRRSLREMPLRASDQYVDSQSMRMRPLWAGAVSARAIRAPGVIVATSCVTLLRVLAFWLYSCASQASSAARLFNRANFTSARTNQIAANARNCRCARRMSQRNLFPVKTSIQGRFSARASVQ